MNADKLFLLAGGITFLAAFKNENGFPSAGYGIISATVALTFVAALSSSSVLGKPIKAFAWLTVLIAILKSTPLLIESGTGITKKGKKK